MNIMKRVLLLLLISFMLIFVIGADSDSDAGAIGLALFLAGPIFYGVIAGIYSGKNKRHDHEVATESQIDGLQFYDNFTKTVKGSTQSSIGTVTYSNQRGGSKGIKENFTSKMINSAMDKL